MGLNLLISFLKFIRIMTPLACLAFISTWFVRINDDDTFMALDFLFGILPRVMDKMVHIEITIHDKTITMGYIFAAILMALVCFGCIKILNILEKYRKLTNGEPLDIDNHYFDILNKKKLGESGKNEAVDDIIQNIEEISIGEVSDSNNENITHLQAYEDNNKNQEFKETEYNAKALQVQIEANESNNLDSLNDARKNEKNINTRESIVIKNEQPKKENSGQIQEQTQSSLKIDTFYCLFEFDVDYIGQDEQSKESLQKIKLEFTKMFADKLKAKYLNAKFAIKDRIIIIFNDFSICMQIADDILKLYEAISSAAEKMAIKANYIMSFHASNKSATPREITKTLVMINKLKYINQIVATENFCSQYVKENPTSYNIESLGSAHFESLSDNIGEVDMDLFKINI